MSWSSATERQQSMAAGVVPQSSCSLRAQAPALTISSSAAGREALPLPAKPRLTGKASAAGVDGRIAGLADAGDFAVLDADIGLHDPPVVEDQRIGDDGVEPALPVG